MRRKGVNVLWIAGGAALLAIAARSSKAHAAEPERQPSSPESDPPRKRALPESSATDDEAVTEADEADEAAAAAKAAEQLEAAHAPLPSKRTTAPKPAPPSKLTAAPPPPSKLTTQAPDGYDPDKARRTAPALAEHLRRKARDYDRRLAKAWQTAAALDADGIYGGATRGALIHYGVRNPPRALFKPTATIPYTPPE